jgi:hypothetical protein
MVKLLRTGRLVLALLAVVVACSLPATAGGTSARWGLVYARIVQHGSARYLVVRINEPSPAARIKVALVSGKHRVLRTVARNIRTNKKVQVRRLTISRKIHTVRIRVLHLIG